MENEKTCRRVLTERKSERISYLGREVVFIEAGTGPREDLQAREVTLLPALTLISLSLKFKLPLYFRHSHGHADTHQKVNCPGQ